MIRSIAVDDEPLALAVIRKFCADSNLVSLVDTFTDAIKALKYLENNPVDLLFLDIRMPDINGIQFLQRLKEPPLVIFTTAYSEFAVKGFELEAVDYLVKPVKYDRFVSALEKVSKWLSLRDASPKSVEEDHLLVRSGYSIISVNFSDITFIEGQDDYIRIHLAGGKPPVMSLMSLKGILEKLPAERFCRVHRSFIVATARIKSIRKKTLTLDSARVPVGDAYADLLNRWFNKNSL